MKGKMKGKTTECPMTQKKSKKTVMPMMSEVAPKKTKKK